MIDPEIEQVPLHKILGEWQVGSADWSWEDERADLESRDMEQLDELATDIRKNGILVPIELGNDGRVWDGHHRIIVAWMLGLHSVPVHRN